MDFHAFLYSVADLIFVIGDCWEMFLNFQFVVLLNSGDLAYLLDPFFRYEWNCYSNFMEFGEWLLCLADSWF